MRSTCSRRRAGSRGRSRSRSICASARTPDTADAATPLAPVGSRSGSWSSTPARATRRRSPTAGSCARNACSPARAVGGPGRAGDRASAADRGRRSRRGGDALRPWPGDRTFAATPPRSRSGSSRSSACTGSPMAGSTRAWRCSTRRWRPCSAARSATPGRSAARAARCWRPATPRPIGRGRWSGRARWSPLIEHEGMVPLWAWCRSTLGGVLTAVGEWERAERELLESLRTYGGAGSPWLGVPAGAPRGAADAPGPLRGGRTADRGGGGPPAGGGHRDRDPAGRGQAPGRCRRMPAPARPDRPPRAGCGVAAAAARPGVPCAGRRDGGRGRRHGAGRLGARARVAPT